MSNEKFEKHLQETGEIGRIIETQSSIISVSGLPNLRSKETIITEDGETGMVYVAGDKSKILMFESEKAEVGKRVVRTGNLFSVPVCDNLLGRIVDPLCEPVDGEGPIEGEKEIHRVEKEAPGIIKRIEINRPLETGVSIIDLMVPIGYGQREMVVGDAKTGKTTFLLQTLASQAKKGKKCVYVGVGKEIAALKEVENYLKEMEVFEEVSMLITTSNQAPTLHYLAPFSGMTIAEYFRDKGQDVVIVFDDLSNHSKAYREISLLLKNPPGREAYPGDIFYLHAALVERAGNIKLDETGEEVSITAIPVAETMENDISGFIQTNLLSMTDGHIFFDINELRKGRKPAVSTSLSVSRAGNQTRDSIDKDLAGKIRDRLVSYRKVLEVTQFGAELSDENQRVLDFGQKMMLLFNQDLYRLVPRTSQFFLFGLLFTGFWKDVPKRTMENEIKIILDALENDEIIEKEELEKKIDEMETAEDLKDFCEDITPKVKKIV